jgi:hypothetical protein
VRHSFYEAQNYKALGSNFNVAGGENRALKGTGATNLLRDSFEGPTFYIEIDDNGDSSFILNADAIDISKSPNPISDFASGNYVIEACVFGFGRGSFDLNQSFKLALTTSAPSTLLLTPNAILPGPLSGSDTALINYSRTPYQGDAWGATSTFSDPNQVVFTAPGDTKPTVIDLPEGVKSKDIEQVIVVKPEVYVVTMKDNSEISTTRVDDLLAKYRK